MESYKITISVHNLVLNKSNLSETQIVVYDHELFDIGYTQSRMHILHDDSHHDGQRIKMRDASFYVLMVQKKIADHSS